MGWEADRGLVRGRLLLGFLFILHRSAHRIRAERDTGLPGEIWRWTYHTSADLVVASTFFHHWETLSGRFRLGSPHPQTSLSIT